jgi:hypothetical protein
MHFPDISFIGETLAHLVLGITAHMPHTTNSLRKMEINGMMIDCR